MGSLLRSKKPQTFIGLWLLVFSGVAAAQDLNPLVAEYLAGYWKAHPGMAATPAGIHLYDKELEDLSPPAQQQEIARLRSFAERLEKLDEKTLSADARLDRGLLLRHVRSALLDLEEGRAWQTRPQDYVILVGRAVLTLTQRQFASPAVRYAAVVARLRSLPKWLRQARLNLEAPPELATRRAIELASATAAYLESGLVQSAGEQGLDKKGVSHLQKETKPAAQALRDFAHWMEQDLLAKSKANPVLGAEKLAHRFHTVLGLEQTPEQLLAEIEASAAAIRAKVASLPAPVPVRADDALRAYRDAAAQTRKFVAGKRWAPLPQPEHLRFETAPAFLDFHGPTLDPAGPFEAGLTYYLYVPDAPCTEQDAVAAAVGLGYPGQYLQREAVNSSPDAVRKVFTQRSFLAGWAPYALTLMLEEGYPGDARPLLRMQLEAIVDLRLHTGRADATQAAALLVEQAGLDQDSADATVRYALLHPGEFSSYYIGQRELLALRERKRKEWAPGFTLREFHEFVLAAAAF